MTNFIILLKDPLESENLVNKFPDIHKKMVSAMSANISDLKDQTKRRNISTIINHLKNTFKNRKNDESTIRK